MSKTNQGSRIKPIICFFLKIALIFAPALFSPGLSAKKTKSAIITYRPDARTDYTDSEETTDHLLPDSPKKLAELIKKNLREKSKSNIVKTKRIHFKKEYYLDLKTMDDVDKVLFILRGVYGANIECDTGTILLAWQIKQQKLSINQLYKFIEIRRLLLTKDLKYKHKHKYTFKDYHDLLTKFFSFMTIKPILRHQFIELPESLPKNDGSIIVLFMKGHPGHMTIIYQGSNGHYEYSCTDTNGNIYLLSSKDGRPDWDQSEIKTAQYGIIKNGSFL